MFLLKVFLKHINVPTWNDAMYFASSSKKTLMILFGKKKLVVSSLF
jgi:hypothetical protein